MSITMIGLDTAKSVFQVHAVDEVGHAEIRRKLRRSELIPFFEKQEACTVVIEACSAAHHWARLLGGLGHEVKLIAPEAVKPFVKKGKKNDAADAAAICAATSRPVAKFVPAKSLDQQSTLALHSARSLLVKQQTMLANALRGLATEFGLTVPHGIGKLGELRALVDTDDTFPEQARQVFARLLGKDVVRVHERPQLAELADALRNGQAKLGRQAAQGVRQHRLLLDQQGSGRMQGQGILLLHAFGWHEFHVGPGCSLAECCRVGRIILLALLHKGPGRLGGD